MAVIQACKVIMCLFCFTALLSTDCLIILLKEVEELDLFGNQLGIQEKMMEAIKKYYNNDRELMVKHIVGMWLRSDPEDPVKKLRGALLAQGHRAIANRLEFLSSSGK